MRISRGTWIRWLFRYTLASPYRLSVATARLLRTGSRSACASEVEICPSRPLRSRVSDTGSVPR